MNKQLRDKIEATIKELDMEIGRKKSQYNNLVIDYNNHVEGVTAAKINELVRYAKELVAKKNQAVKDLKDYELAAAEKNTNYRHFIIVENDLASRYGVELIDDFVVDNAEQVERATQTKVVEQPVVQVQQPKNHTFRDIVIGALLVGAAVSIASCADHNNTFTRKETTSQVDEGEFESAYDKFIEKVTGIFTGHRAPSDEPATPVAPAEEMQTGDVEYGVKDDEVTAVYGHLTDASDEAQVMARAQAIYKNHIDLPNVPAAMKAQLSVETIANMIRVSNGELAIIDGRPYYEMDIMDMIANDFASYYNATSFVQFGTNLQFAPVSVFFEEDTLAYESAKMHDQYAARIYEDIRGNQVEQFRQDSIAWGEFVRDTFIYNDFTGQVPSIWQMDTGSMFPLTSAIISLYGPTIQEYSQGVDLARRDGNNMFGDTFGICIPFCYNEHNELTEIPLSKLIYDINYTPMNDLARRAGMYEQWASEHTPITVNMWNNSNDYMTDKYEREVGFGRSLN